MTAQWPYSVTVTPSAGGARNFVLDTSFEPYRREAFRHKSIQPQRQSIMMTNIVGEGTVNTEGLWRREQVEWSMGAGQYSLDRKGDSQETRFYSSKGVDVFSYPLQAKLLPDVERVDALTANNNMMATRCGDKVVVVNGSSVVYYTTSASGSWSAPTTCTYNTVYGGSTPSVIRSIDANDTYTFIATDTGIWFSNIGRSGSPYITGASEFRLYAANDVATGYTGGYDVVRYVNEQVVASRGARLYAFQKRTTTDFPQYGAVPSINNVSVVLLSAKDDGTMTNTWTATTDTAHGLSIGQPFTITATAVSSTMTIPQSLSNAGNISITGTTVTCTSVSGLSVSVNDTVTVSYTFYDNSSPQLVLNTFVDTGIVTSIGSSSFVYTTANPSAVSANLYYSYEVAATAVGDHPSVLAGTYKVKYTTAGSNTFTFSDPGLVLGLSATGGVVSSTVLADVLYTHENSSWVWSDIVGGYTQVYYAGYVKGASGQGYGGCIYRSSFQGSTTTTSTGVSSTSNTSVFQPFQLNTPLQALPMSPDEYPTCITSYLNYIFIGTNRGIRMAQTLSIYDPTATQTGDLKSGPVIPNVIQPLAQPVTAIIGDGRYIWFSWNQYDTASTGLGRLDLGTFIANDPLAPAYASDVMVPYTGAYAYSTGQGMINSLVWDPVRNLPVMAIGGKGIYAPKATNVNGLMTVVPANGNTYVASGSITSGYFDYGIPDTKVGFGFAYNAVNPTGCSVAATVISDPDMPSPKSANITAFSGNGSYDTTTQILNTDGSTVRANQFQVTVTLNAGSSNANSPTLHRWTLKAWPTVVQGTSISAVFQLSSVDVVDGMEVFIDPYDNFTWLENLRQIQDVVTYTEGPISAPCIIETLDWIPHKRRDNYENGFEGDCVVMFKTLAPYTYTNVATS